MSIRSASLISLYKAKVTFSSGRYPSSAHLLKPCVSLICKSTWGGMGSSLFSFLNSSTLTLKNAALAFVPSNSKFVVILFSGFFGTDARCYCGLVIASLGDDGCVTLFVDTRDSAGAASGSTGLFFLIFFPISL